MRFLAPLTTALCAIASSGVAKGFDRPIPQAQSATAENWFALGSLALIIALFAVHRLVARS